MNKILWFDTETTGLDPVKNDIIQIAGMIEIDNKVVEHFNFKCAPFNPDNIEEQALKVTGLKKEDVLNYDSPKDVYDKLTTIFSRHIDKYDKTDKFIPAGHNVGFDVDMLKQFFIKNDDVYFGSYVSYHKLDTLSLAIALNYWGFLPTKPENFKLKILCDIFGIKIEAHEAGSDINATRELFAAFTAIVIMPKKQFSKDKTPEYICFSLSYT